MNSKSLFYRITTIFIIVIAFCIASSAVLFDLQIVNGEDYRVQADNRLSGNTPIYAARGEILDRNGNKLVSNSMAFLIHFNKSYWNDTEQNEIILQLIKLLDSQYLEYETSFPISLSSSGFIFSENTSSLEAFLKSKKASSDVVTPDDIIEFLAYRYKIDENLYPYEILQIISVRYEMEQQNFSTFNVFTFAKDVNIEAVTIIRENFEFFKGVEIATMPIREYQTPYAAHILGRVGPIFAEEYAELKSEGYALNAIIGKDGMEKVLEPYLRATDGRQAADIIIKDEIVAKGMTIDPIAGNNVTLTLDLELQKVAEESLEKTFFEIKENGYDIEGGAAVVIDVNTGEILALASYPTYNLETYNQDFNLLNQDPLKPMLNRAISGTYAPGSTYKMVTALAALEESVATVDTKIRDQGIYKYYEDYTPRCWIYRDYGATHGVLDVSGALKHSCNYYFYEVGRLLTASKLEEYTKLVGLGQATGIELPERVGTVAGPTNREEKGTTWYPGDTLAAAIGQSDHLYTPLQLANYVATFANGGTLNQAHLIKKVESHDYSQVILDNKPEPFNIIDIEPKNLEAILQGMSDVVNEGGTAARIFGNYPIQVAGKTGSAQVDGGSATGVFVSYAPFENPEIAICVLGERGGSGGNVAPVVRDLYDEYFGLNEIENN